MKKILFSLFVIVTWCSLISVASAFPSAMLSKTYLSFDTGYAWGLVAKPTFPGAILKREGTANSPFLGFGVGYHFNQFIRLAADLTYRFGYRASVSDEDTPPGIGKGKVNSLIGLLNAYWDIKKIGRFVPYIGGGIGIVRNAIGTISVTNAGVLSGTIPGGHKINFACQASIGTALNLTKQFSLDIGYRYLYLGRVTSGLHYETPIGPGTGRFSGLLHSNEFHIGARYNLP